MTGSSERSGLHVMRCGLCGEHAPAGHKCEPAWNTRPSSPAASDGDAVERDVDVANAMLLAVASSGIERDVRLTELTGDEWLLIARAARAAIDRQPSPPPTGSEREKVVEECARIADAAVLTTPGAEGARNHIRAVAAVIRALASQQPTGSEQ